ncbi:hemerythrin domain-containing protein [Glycomyces harbinensis]|uniref:Hemerythrin HHE cation binding domain-containing protein n=1 Tax=Glycomyces harbinensis TaxID=58114 RepID=A0A1G6SNR1_9ACTN|nr:hemerythrin domain-containing protein [Glycomyces harbinensis]SDD18519.1 Hemerythrin HHE cation binding domain-containing protein [Glycomyces harbinensis]
MTHAEQDTELIRDTDLIAVVLEDHRRFEARFAELEESADEAVGRKDLVDHVIAELVRHEVAVEQFMYPVARAKLPDGDAVVDRELAAHAEAEQVMKRLEGLGPADPEFEGLVAEMVEDVRRHMVEEEANLLPRLRECCDAEELQHWGYKVLAAKEFAPTRPHPHSPDKPPANLILGPGVGFVDKIRDALGDRDV